MNTLLTYLVVDLWGGNGGSANDKERDAKNVRVDKSRALQLSPVLVVVSSRINIATPDDNITSGEGACRLCCEIFSPLQ